LLLVSPDKKRIDVQIGSLVMVADASQAEFFM